METKKKVLYTCNKCGVKYYFTGTVANEKEWQCSKCKPFKLSLKWKVSILIFLVVLFGCVRCFFVYPLEKIFLSVMIAYFAIASLWAFSMLEPSHKMGHWVNRSTKSYIRAATTEELHPEWANEQRQIKARIKAHGFLNYVFGLFKSWLLLGIILSLLIGTLFGWKSIILALIK